VIGARVIRAALIAALSIAMAACATASRRGAIPSESFAAPAAAGASAAHSREIMVDTALSMLGQPYRFGGSAPGGFDCSGLVFYAASGAGVSVPRTALEQLHSGMPVRRGALRTGDLVFMHLARKELHVGIALDNGRFIHAPSAGGRVRIDSLGAAPYSKGFIAARRLIDAPRVGYNSPI
jgi:cell wall-associated NlpC family hydrolase